MIEHRPDIVFDDADHVRRIINKIAEQAGMRCDETHAMGCAMLPGGRARATYVVPPISPDGPALNVRTFSDGMLSMEDLLGVGALPAAMADFLCAAVQARCPIVISGGTGSGKTTLLGALSGFIPAGERVITIEDTPELRLQTAMSSACRRARPTWRAKGPSACGSSWRCRCAVGPTASSWASAAAPRRTTCSRPCRPTIPGR